MGFEVKSLFDFLFILLKMILISLEVNKTHIFSCKNFFFEGTAPGLYSEEEVQDIVGHMMPGGVQTKRVDKIEQAFERFVKRIRQNLHVVVCLNYKGEFFIPNSTLTTLF